MFWQALFPRSSESWALSPLIELVNDLGETDKEWAIDFGIDAMRSASWAFANVLADLPAEKQEELVAGRTW